MEPGKVVAIYIAPQKGAPMQKREEIMALTGAGLEGDRYATREGSFSRKDDEAVNRQVTLINARFFENSGFDYSESRRNLIVSGVELNWLSAGRMFKVGEAVFQGVKYCDPCERPNKLSGNSRSFAKAFFDCGGIIAEVIEGGLIRVNDAVVPPPRGY